MHSEFKCCVYVSYSATGIQALECWARAQLLVSARWHKIDVQRELKRNRLQEKVVPRAMPIIPRRLQILSRAFWRPSQVQVEDWVLQELAWSSSRTACLALPPAAASVLLCWALLDSHKSPLGLYLSPMREPQIHTGSLRKGIGTDPFQPCRILVPRGTKRTSPHLSWTCPMAHPLICPFAVTAAQSDSCSRAVQHLTLATLRAFCRGSTDTRQSVSAGSHLAWVPVLWKCKELTCLGTHSFFGLSNYTSEVL